MTDNERFRIMLIESCLELDHGIVIKPGDVETVQAICKKHNRPLRVIDRSRLPTRLTDRHLIQQVQPWAEYPNVIMFTGFDAEFRRYDSTKLWLFKRFLTCELNERRVSYWDGRGNITVNVPVPTILISDLDFDDETQFSQRVWQHFLPGFRSHIYHNFLK